MSRSLLLCGVNICPCHLFFKEGNYADKVLHLTADVTTINYCFGVSGCVPPLKGPGALPAKQQNVEAAQRLLRCFTTDEVNQAYAQKRGEISP